MHDVVVLETLQIIRNQFSVELQTFRLKLHLETSSNNLVSDGGFEVRVRRPDADHASELAAQALAEEARPMLLQTMVMACGPHQQGLRHPLGRVCQQQARR